MFNNNLFKKALVVQQKHVNLCFNFNVLQPFAKLLLSNGHEIINL
jgi:hypothetical protein